MRKTPVSIPNPGISSRRKNVCAAVTDFIRMHAQLSGMLPNATRLMALQEACEQILPNHFAACQVLQLETGRLSVSVPAQATAARLRQKLPLLKTGLEQAGWAVDDIRIKVKPKQKIRQPTLPEKKALSSATIDELEKLKASLAESGTHPALMNALLTMVAQHRKNPE